MHLLFGKHAVAYETNTTLIKEAFEACGISCRVAKTLLQTMVDWTQAAGTGGVYQKSPEIDKVIVSEVKVQHKYVSMAISPERKRYWDAERFTLPADIASDGSQCRGATYVRADASTSGAQTVGGSPAFGTAAAAHCTS